MIPQTQGLPPLISQHPDVDTQVVFEPTDFIEPYEDNKVILLRTPGILPLSSSDWEFINAIQPKVAAGNGVKKAKMRYLMAPLEDPEKHVICRMGVPKDQVGRMQSLVGVVSSYLRRFAVAAFPGYKFAGEDITWRFTTTEAEEMHYDSYGVDPVESHHVRLFINLDQQPRLWGIGRPVSTTLQLYRDRMYPHRELHPNLLNAALNKHLPWPKIPKHFAMFMPGNAWLVNSQSVAHEIIYGRKLIACTFMVDPASMRYPAKSFNNIVKEAVSRM